MNPENSERLRGALWGMFVGDSLAMPAHWYYDVTALHHDFGVLSDYQAPKNYHPNSTSSAVLEFISPPRTGHTQKYGGKNLPTFLVAMANGAMQCVATT